jgi:hypothetical protein
MEIEKVYVNPDNTAVVKCPHCETTKIVPVGKFKGPKRRLKIRCGCKASFRISFEFRKAYRKKVQLSGDYTKVAPAQGRGKMQVKDISMTGIKFATATKHNLAAGEALSLAFTLDDRNRSRVEKDVVIRWVKDKEVGCQFTESLQYDKVFGFYLMS